ncbi:hypothetical protein [Fodinicola feengrottensis]|uniref:hypothetical protein n=1 Tax=Fodinicola feengrottensis TaxID=435914 RepID=UPI0013D13E3B|nr:hypothetical protein [Fodinicola feengrottensis]
MAANRRKLLSKELYQQLEAADDNTQRQVAQVVMGMALDATPDSTGRADVEAALSAGQDGDSDLRQWLQQTSKAAGMASYEAEELDGNRSEAERSWRSSGDINGQRIYLGTCHPSQPGLDRVGQQ